MQEAIQTTLVIGHRGASALHPENTLRAFREAMRAGADGVEMDVHEARDASFLVHHDSHLGGGEELASLDLAEIRTRGPAEADLRVPTLTEVFEALRPHAPRITLVELKEVRSVGRLGDLVSATSASSRGLGLLVMSFDLDLLGRLRAVDGAIRLGLVSADGVPEPAGFLVRHGLDALILRHDRVNRDLASGLRTARRGLYAWTVNDEKEARRLVECGVDGLITDDPGRIRRAL